MSGDPPSRRDFFRKGLRSLGKLIAGAVEHVEANVPVPRMPLRPPGAKADFDTTCTTCGKCIDACFPGTLFRDGPAAALPGAPTFDPRKKPCYLCPTLPCADACPSGALEVLLPATSARMGTAEVQTSRCWAWIGMDCQKCVDACPSKHVAIVLDAERRPVVNADACTGCGACETACPENPAAIRVIAK